MGVHGLEKVDWVMEWFPGLKSARPVSNNQQANSEILHSSELEVDHRAIGCIDIIWNELEDTAVGCVGSCTNLDGDLVP